MRELFQNAGFRRLWASVVTLSLGDALMQMSLLELFHRYHYDERVQTAKLLFAVALPGLLFGPVAMAYLDRWQRRTVLLVSDGFRALVVGGIAAWLWRLQGRMSEPHLLVIYALIFLIGTVAAFYLPARVALLPNLVPKPLLMRANTLFTSSIAVASIGGRALGGFVAERFGPMTGVLANTAAYGLSVLWLSGIRMWPHATSRDVAGRATSGWVELRTGMAYLWRHGLALRLVCVAGAFAFIGGLVLVEMVGYAMDTLGLGTGGVGYLIGAGGLGAAAGLAICARSPVWARSNGLTPALLTLVGAALLAMGATQRVWLAVPLVMALGAAGAMTAIHVDTKLQEHLEETRRGAVFATRGMLTSLATVLAFWLQFGTALLTQTPPPVVLRGLGAAALAGGGLALLATRARLNRTRR